MKTTIRLRCKGVRSDYVEMGDYLGDRASLRVVSQTHGVWSDAVLLDVRTAAKLRAWLGQWIRAARKASR